MMAAKSSFLPPSKSGHPRVSGKDGAAHPRTSLDDDTVEMIEEWSADNPPGDWERERNRRIEKIQGNRNLFVRPK